MSLLMNCPVSEKITDIVETMCKSMLISSAHTDLTQEAAIVFGFNMILHIFQDVLGFLKKSNWSVKTREY